VIPPASALATSLLASPTRRHSPSGIPGTATLSVTQASLAGTGFSTSGLALPLSVAPEALCLLLTWDLRPPLPALFSGKHHAHQQTRRILRSSFHSAGPASRASCKLSVSPAITRLWQPAPRKPARKPERYNFKYAGTPAFPFHKSAQARAGFTTFLHRAPAEPCRRPIHLVQCHVCASFNRQPRRQRHRREQCRKFSAGGRALRSRRVACELHSFFELDARFFDVFRASTFIGGTISGGPYTRVDSSMIPTTPIPMRE